MTNNQLRFFSGKIVTSLADIFTIKKKKKTIQNISGTKVLIVDRFSQFLRHLLKHLECQMVTWSYFLGVSEK